MISWIIFFTGVVASVGLGFLANHQTMPFWQVLVIFVVALIILLVINAICALVCSKWLPKKFYNSKSKFYNPNKSEIDFYNKLQIKKWKDKTLEWGKLNGFSKSKIENPKDPEYIQKFILECNKGYLGHLISIFASLFILLCVPKTLILPMALPMFITSFLINYLSVAILRFNVARLNTLLKFVLTGPGHKQLTLTLLFILLSSS